MKRAAIVTIISGNFGNRLQNYALQTVLEKRGLRAETLKLKPNYPSKSRVKYFVKKLLSHMVPAYREKTAWEKFNLKIRWSPFTAEAPGLADAYDYFFAGSDQIWNPTFSFNSQREFLTFAPDEKKIAFAASIGLDALPEAYTEAYRKYISAFRALSMREEAGARIVRELTGRDAQVLVDPTLLLTKEDWKKIEKRPRGVKEDYILTCFLSPPSPEAARCLEENQGGRQVYSLLDPRNPVLWNAGPSEFLWLVNHADLILTDSFHACVFSFLFGRPFVVFDRNWEEGNMNSRLETLLKKFRLERKYALSGLENRIFEHDYSEGYRVLDRERERAAEFLNQVLAEKG